MIAFYYIGTIIVSIFAFYGFYCFTKRSTPDFMFELDETDPEDIKPTIRAKLPLESLKSGKCYILKVNRINKDSRDK